MVITSVHCVDAFDRRIVEGDRTIGNEGIVK